MPDILWYARGRLEGADIIERPPACHHPSLGLSSKTVRNAAGPHTCASILLLSGENSNPVIFRVPAARPLVSLLTPRAAAILPHSRLSDMLKERSVHSSDTRRLNRQAEVVVRRARPSPSPKVWEEVTFLKRAATAKRRRSKFPKVFRGLRRQRLIFFFFSSYRSMHFLHCCLLHST